MLSLQSLWAQYWSLPVIEVNLLVFANLLGALLLGLVVGYERSYHSRAAGMRTYGIVCMAACALTVFAGYPEFWWGRAHTLAVDAIDVTRVVQGIVTGIGFLGAGVIMRDGLNISGLTTAASIWATAGIGVLVGVGFYAAAMLLTVLSAALMLWGAKLEARLPALSALGVVLGFAEGVEPDEAVVRQTLRDCGYQLAEGSLTIAWSGAQATWHFVMVARRARPPGDSLVALSQALRRVPGVSQLNLAHARN
ncbi:MgtC/SapB family protein [Macromonas nakdongensis]|uniref:MgtC/SapB family protein n=1 Tax=Macromonas nakdongensis TaxID=1843082 RepID=UPI000C337E3E|nr:MgtC/SapB family protein [Macromonas nakdongensis]